MLIFLRTFPEYLVEQNTFQKVEHLNVASGTAEAAACSQSFVDTEYLRAFSSARLLLSEHVHQIHGERLNARTLLANYVYRSIQILAAVRWLCAGSALALRWLLSGRHRPISGKFYVKFSHHLSFLYFY